MTIEQIKSLIADNRLDEAEKIIKSLLETRKDDLFYYLLGNIQRKRGNWQEALNNYYQAMEINPESPASIAAESLNNILNYRNKELMNP